MKELTIKQKSQRYDEALNRGKEINKEHYKKGFRPSDDVLYIFPELKKSDDENADEKVIKALIKLVTNYPSMDLFIEYDIHLYEALAWLEKQKVITTEEDLQGKEDVLWCIKQAQKYAKDEDEMGTCWFAENWLKKQGEQKPVEWSEEDEGNRRYCINAINGIPYYSPENKQELVNWLKSLRPQKQWKPSEEQMNALDDVISSMDIKYDVLSELYKDLKKLREE